MVVAKKATDGDGLCSKLNTANGVRQYLDACRDSLTNLEENTVAEICLP